MKTKECKNCKKQTPISELEENAKYSYGAICDNCADIVDQQNDSNQQDK